MTKKEVENYAKEHEIDILLLDNPNFDKSIIGISYDDRVIYDYDRMIQDLMETDNISYEDAVEYIEYNTLRALSYFDNAPIILYTKEVV